MNQICYIDYIEIYEQFRYQNVKWDTFNLSQEVIIQSQVDIYSPSKHFILDGEDI